MTWDAEYFEHFPKEDYVGYSAMLCATMIYLPQIIKTCKTKSIESISYGLLFMELLTDVLWNIYAQMKDLKPLMFSSSFLFLSCFICLCMKVNYSEKASISCNCNWFGSRKRWREKGDEHRNIFSNIDGGSSYG